MALLIVNFLWTNIKVSVQNADESNFSRVIFIPKNGGHSHCGRMQLLKRIRLRLNEAALLSVLWVEETFGEMMHGWKAAKEFTWLSSFGRILESNKKNSKIQFLFGKFMQ